MLKKVKTVALDGMQGQLIEIETDISKGLPYFTIIGMADTSVREASERVKRAVINSGFEYPKGKITVNLSPAYIHKRGSHYDLGIAIGLLLLQNIVEVETDDTLFIGELSLDGKILPSKGALPMVMSIIERDDHKIKEIILSKDNCSECYLFTKGTNVKLIPVTSLVEVVEHLQGKKIEQYIETNLLHRKPSNNLDFQEVKGQKAAKEAIMIAVAGGHNILMIGSPGAGKTMLAKRIVSVLPPMSLREQIETTKIYSYAGKLSSQNPIVSERPFRHITSGITLPALIGGGNYPMPGEVSFAHNGVLFIDEMLLFPERTLESLRTPIEDGEINITRKGNQTTFPSNFILVGATNPCKCGYLGDKNYRCSCTQTEINNYRSRLSGPLSDRIDIAVEINRINYNELENSEGFHGGLSSKTMHQRIFKARNRQKERYEGFDFELNGNLDDKYIDEFCILNRECKKFMESIYEKQHISPRRYYKILKVARTIADIKEEDVIEIDHLAAAFHYTRFLMERGWQE